MQKIIINFSVALFIISCGQVTGQENINKSDKSQLAAKHFPDDTVVRIADDMLKVLKRTTDRLILLHNIRDSLSITRELPDSTKRKYSVKLKNKIEVYGFYDYTTGAAVQTDRLFSLNTFIYNSLFIQSATGKITDIHGWKDADIITTAQNHGCDVGVTFAFKKTNEDTIFLQNNSSQSTFIREAIELLKFRSGKAINISFKNISPAVKHHFFNFSKRLYETLKKTDSSYKLLLTIPAITSANYPLSELLTISDRVIIDFSEVSEKYALNAAPLASLSGLKDTLTYFINSGIQKEKIVVCLPYRGAIWKVNAGKKAKFIDYIKYKDLRRTYNFEAYTSYAPDSFPSFVVMDSFRIVKRDTTLLKQIYYDDVSSIGKKYEFILDQGFKGVAVKYLGDDFGYTGLWDEMSYAFAEPDTVYTDSTKQIKAGTGVNFFKQQHSIAKMSNLLVRNVVFLQNTLSKPDSKYNPLMYHSIPELNAEVFNKSKSNVSAYSHIVKLEIHDEKQILFYRRVSDNIIF